MRKCLAVVVQEVNDLETMGCKVYVRSILTETFDL